MRVWPIIKYSHVFSWIRTAWKIETLMGASSHGLIFLMTWCFTELITTNVGRLISGVFREIPTSNHIIVSPNVLHARFSLSVSLMHNLSLRVSGFWRITDAKHGSSCAVPQTLVNMVNMMFFHFSSLNEKVFRQEHCSTFSLSKTVCQ